MVFDSASLTIENVKGLIGDINRTYFGDLEPGHGNYIACSKMVAEIDLDNLLADINNASLVPHIIKTRRLLDTTYESMWGRVPQRVVA